MMNPKMNQPMFELTFLGTSSGMPTRSRNVSGLAISLLGMDADHGKHTPWLLIDCGEGTQHQLLKTHHKPSNLAAILITHVHGDHCYGLMGLLSSLAMHGRTKPLTIIAPKAIDELLTAFIRITEMNLSYPIEFIDVADILGAPPDSHDGNAIRLRLGGGLSVDILAHPLKHRTDSYGYRIEQWFTKDKLNTDALT